MDNSRYDHRYWRAFSRRLRKELGVIDNGDFPWQAESTILSRPVPTYLGLAEWAASLSTEQRPRNHVGKRFYLVELHNCIDIIGLGLSSALLLLLIDYIASTYLRAYMHRCQRALDLPTLFGYGCTKTAVLCTLAH
jgi:hypothetical protein